MRRRSLYRLNWHVFEVTGINQGKWLDGDRKQKSKLRWDTLFREILEPVLNAAN